MMMIGYLQLTVMKTSSAGGRKNMPVPPASWPLTFWPWKWCPSHVWRGLPLYQF